MMVLRERKINNKSDVVQLHVSFGLPDIKALFKVYAKRLCVCGVLDGVSFAKSLEHSEGDVRCWLEHDPIAFANYPDKWRVQLSAWAFNVAVRNNLLKKSATKENSFFLADCLFTKRGRPSKKDV